MVPSEDPGCRRYAVRDDRAYRRQAHPERSLPSIRLKQIGSCSYPLVVGPRAAEGSMKVVAFAAAAPTIFPTISSAQVSDPTFAKAL